MKFKDYRYHRPDIENYQEKISDLLEKIGGNVDEETELKAIHEFFDLNDQLDSMATLVSIRNSLDTKDEFYQKEQDFFDENGPKLQMYNNLFSKQLIASKNRKFLEEKLGQLIFKQAELQEKTFSEEIIPDLQKENKLSTKYSKLLAGAEIEFEGKIYNLTQMGPFLQSLDRDTRHKAQLKTSQFFEENEKEIDQIYDDMVKVRHKIAKTLGYENYVQLGYDRLGRTDYNHKDVKNYRDQIYNEVVPLVKELVERKAKRIGIENPKSYDLALSFKTGNPTPKGDLNWQVNIAKNMYEEMSKETGEFFNFMLEHELLELDSKPGKAGGGYCTYIPNYKSPFIFANFNGTSHDVNVLTHEAGHAFQIYSSQEQIPSYRWPTMEAAEIHSMSMEFLAWPWIDGFFKEDTDKYKFYHLDSSLSFLPYGVAVDEFQHEVYNKPEMTPDQRKATWRKIEKKYLPFKDYDDDHFMEKGTYWFKQGHIFSVPFYYIDYTLAQVLAFQFFVLSQENHELALDKYIKLCRLGGSKSFVDLVESTKLNNPFKKGTIKSVIEPIKAFLDQVNDQDL
ncbi:M3 family oligoendopeptidase [Hujiaoplasma nucleasis]|uniref:M3 family oligoendopeptidase n=1 Tax=Hujiaoplasma nucleasis TaxID=2725268 RepID=A0A7L6N4M2_9MOLU|nr:M3 family oligoendopeptidase [Hujiaoplasma nucleasis]QLY39945.1 M3 family oligoendopeptidase [Hujiaoplasma nucleasis]